jgi:cbb3-type cytochrome oxidase subunit 3
VAAGLLIMMFYFFLSKKSSKGLKLLALAALILSGVAVSVCGFFIAFGFSVEAKEGAMEQIIFNEPPVPAQDTSMTGFAVFLAVLIIFFTVIIFLAVRDQKRKAVDAAIAGFKDKE